MGELLKIDFADAFAAVSPAYELFVSAPIVGVGPDQINSHREEVETVVVAATEHVNGVYCGREIGSTSDLAAPDLATETNLKAFVQCEAYLYVQFAEIVSPTGALIELGLALGRKVKTTVFIRQGLSIPYMLAGF